MASPLLLQPPAKPHCLMHLGIDQANSVIETDHLLAHTPQNAEELAAYPSCSSGRWQPAAVKHSQSQVESC